MKIDKAKKDVIIFTLHHRLEGTMHTYMGARILDELNAGAKTFIALTNVSVFLPQGTTPIYHIDFIALNKNHIVHLLPGKGEDFKEFLPKEEIFPR
ncbi:MAG: hypothetical protein AB1297_01910 [bacterium]